MISETFQLLMSFFAPLPGAEIPVELSAIQAPAPNTAGLSCNLSLDRTSGGTRLVAKAIATQGALHGRYELTVVKMQGSNRSRARQGGEFDAAPGEPEVLGTVNLSGPKGSMQAELIVDDGIKPVICTTR